MGHEADTGFLTDRGRLVSHAGLTKHEITA
jgi:hypothetical protein